MKVLPFVLAPAPVALPNHKAPRLSVCCRISELIPLVRQLHDEARAARMSREVVTLQQAA